MQERQHEALFIAFDGWYSSLDNLKLLRELAWQWLTRLKSNRQVSQQKGVQQAIADWDIPASGLVVHLRGYGLIKVFRTVDPHGNAEFRATSRLDLDSVGRQAYADCAWLIEDYHRSLKQFTGIQAGQFRLEFHRWQSHLPIFDAKLNIIRQALRLYLAQPSLVLPSTA